jgi:hypothetical protein
MSKKVTVRVNPKAAIDSNEAAKGKTIPLDKDMIAVMETLLMVADNARRQAHEAQVRAELYADQCAKVKGILLKDFNLDWDQKAFVPK